MAFAIGISFPVGRFHATSWDHHVNEGLPEWPPSPWRLLRSLIATWKRKLPHEEQIDVLMPEIIEKLLQAPLFRLPPATLGHTRHYMPAKKKPALVFDAFVALEKHSQVIFAWPEAVLEENEIKVMNQILAKLDYFGRSESWCSAGVVDFPRESEINCRWIKTTEEELPPGLEPVRVLCPDPKSALANDHTPKRVVATGRGKKRTEEHYPFYDPDWHLCMETRDLHEQRWSRAPGSRWVTYARPGDSFTQGLRARPLGGDDRIVAARYVIDGPVLPQTKETLYLGEIARRFAQGQFGRLFDGMSSPVLSGKDEDGKPLEGHGHGFFLPTDEDGDGRLDHLLVYSRDGFGSKEIRTLDALRRLRRPGGGVELNLLLSGWVDDRDDSVADRIPVLARATVWRSVTPFILTRHYKKRGKKRDTCAPLEFPEVVLREELQRRGFPEPVRIRPLERCMLWDHSARCAASSGRSLRWIEFRRERVYGNGRSGSQSGCGFEIEFPELVSGPIAVGYGCHFGLGLFAPMA